MKVTADTRWLLSVPEARWMWCARCVHYYVQNDEEPCVVCAEIYKQTGRAGLFLWADRVLELMLEEMACG